MAAEILSEDARAEVFPATGRFCATCGDRLPDDHSGRRHTCWALAKVNEGQALSEQIPPDCVWSGEGHDYVRSPRGRDGRGDD